MRPRPILSILLFVAAIVSTAQPQLRDLDIRVVLSKNGDARVTERRTMTIDEQGTECYIGLKNMGSSEVTGLSVTDETEVQYANVDWDVNESREWKTRKCGIVKKADGYELCWGLGSEGQHTYTTSYIISKMVCGYTDACALRHVFLDAGVWPKPEHARITMAGSDSTMVFTPDSCGVWGFRFSGDLWFANGEMVIETTEPMSDKAALYVMATFPLSMFTPDYREDDTFEHKKQLALQGSDYTYGDDRLTAEEVLICIAVVLCIFVLPIISGVWYVVYVWRARRRVHKDLLWYRDIPLGGNLQKANDILNAYKYFTTDYNNLLSASILRLIDLGAITIEMRPNRKGKMEQNFVIHPLVRLGDQPLLIRKMHSIFQQAAGSDTVLEPRELKQYMSSNNNESVTESFINTLHTKTSISQYKEREAEVRQVLGLRKFLKEFTLMDERHVSEVTLWKDYMVYATLFGIADQVIRDMKQINPEYFNMDQVASQMADDMTLPTINSTMRHGTSAALANKLAREARANGGGGHSSWGGGGGGFSGGGGGGGVR